MRQGSIHSFASKFMFEELASAAKRFFLFVFAWLKGEPVCRLFQGIPVALPLPSHNKCWAFNSFSLTRLYLVLFLVYPVYQTLWSCPKLLHCSLCFHLFSQCLELWSETVFPVYILLILWISKPHTLVP